MSCYMCTGTSLQPLIPHEQNGENTHLITNKYAHQHPPEPLRQISSVSVCVLARVHNPTRIFRSVSCVSFVVAISNLGIAKCY